MVYAYWCVRMVNMYTYSVYIYTYSHSPYIERDNVHRLETTVGPGTSACYYSPVRHRFLGPAGWFEFDGSIANPVTYLSRELSIVPVVVFLYYASNSLTMHHFVANRVLFWTGATITVSSRMFRVGRCWLFRLWALQFQGSRILFNGAHFEVW